MTTTTTVVVVVMMMMMMMMMQCTGRKNLKSYNKQAHCLVLTITGDIS
jgi:preprotein translocase subunit YajC